WIDIGGKNGGFRFQPSEFMKIILALSLAKYLHDDPKLPIGPRGGGRTLKDLIVPAGLPGIPFVLVAEQARPRTALILAGIFVTVMALGKMRLWSLAKLVAGLTAFSYVAWNYILHDYQKRRVSSFLNPELDIRGANWHSHHARVAIGNGGFFG